MVSTLSWNARDVGSILFLGAIFPIKTIEVKIVVPRTGIETTSPVFQASVLTITPPRFPDVTVLPTPTCLSGSLTERSVETATAYCSLPSIQ